MKRYQFKHTSISDFRFPILFSDFVGDVHRNRTSSDSDQKSDFLFGHPSPSGEGECEGPIGKQNQKHKANERKEMQNQYSLLDRSFSDSDFKIGKRT